MWRQGLIITIDSRQLEEAERRQLARYALFSSESRGRRIPEPEDPLRTPWRRDRDRIVHCGAFRRLEYKTQVFVYHEGDHYRTRLTHSMEVSQVARSVAIALGLNESFAEALALAHDLGHPPFGHAGEDALCVCMAAHGGFEHNAQALRVVDWLERSYPSFRGLNLTYEIRSSLLKHGAGATAGLGEDLASRQIPWLEAQVVDLADRIAYNNHDLDDGLRSGLLTPEELAGVEIWRQALEQAHSLHGALSENDLARCARARVIKAAIGDSIEHSRHRIESAVPDNAEEARRGGALIGFSPETGALIEELQQFLYAKLYRARSVLDVRSRCAEVVTALFDAYTNDPDQMAADYRESAAHWGVPRAAADYVAGMTDRFAEQEHARLNGRPTPAN